VIREGSGPEVLLVHGGASPRTTWGALESLESRWTLALVHRRGYPPSPSPPGAGHDFDIDASDLAPLLELSPHVVAHSYGVLGTLIAASRAPMRIRSLTLIEPPLFYLVPDDSDVAHLEHMGNAVLTQGLDADGATLRGFLRLAGVSRCRRRAAPRGGRQRGSPCARRTPTRRGPTGPRRPSRRRGSSAGGLRRPRARAGADLRRARHRVVRRAAHRARRRTLRGGCAGLRRSARGIPCVGELSTPMQAADGQTSGSVVALPGRRVFAC